MKTSRLILFSSIYNCAVASVASRSRSSMTTQLTTNNQEETKTMKTKLIRLHIKLPIKPALACFAAFLIVGCASTTTAPSTPPAATVRIQEWSAAYYGSATGGKGTLYYNGQRQIGRAHV